MPRLEDHPTVRAVRNRAPGNAPEPLDLAELLRICREAGADDSGLVALDRPELEDQRSDILGYFPQTRSLISYVCRMNPSPIRSPARSVSNLEFHSTGDHVNDVGRRIAGELTRRGYRAVNPPMGFPMEMDRFPGKIWTVSMKPLAEAAGLGRMGIHRNVIHPVFGNFILLGAVLTDLPAVEQSTPIEYNPCLECRLCVAACPVGAIAPDGGFNFSACFTHNYREFMSGFTDWAEAVVDSKDAIDYRRKVTDSESASIWQSLSFGANYKAAYCMSVCPAGEDVITPFLLDRGGFVQEILKPLQRKEETVYVLPGSDAEDHVKKRFPHKRVKKVGAVLRPGSIAGFIRLMRHGFQPGKSKGIDAVYHFRFTGEEPAECTVVIRDQGIEVQDGLSGRCDLRVTADSRGWLRFLRKEVGIVRLLLTRRVRLQGNPRHLVAFGRCFP